MRYINLVLFKSSIFLCWLGFLVLYPSKLRAQVDLGYEILDSNLYTPSGKNQLIDYKNYLNIYPPKPKDLWELGLKAGIMNIRGDVSSQITPAALGISIRKSLGYLLSVRGEYNFGVAKGQNLFPTFDFANDQAYQAYNGNLFSGVWRNYRTIAHNFGLQGLWSISNLFFHGTRDKFHVYAISGGELFLYNVRIDALNTNNTLYPFDGFTRQNAQFDGIFETAADQAFRYALGFSLGMGAQYFINSNINIQLENKYTFTNRHDLDGSRFSGVNNPTFQADNGVNLLTLGINFLLGNNKHRLAPLWRINPLNYLYTAVNTPRTMKIPEPKLKDGDEDGVADIFDREPNTPSGVSVDTHGVTLDTDGDGIPDYSDAELITPSFCRPVNESGVGTCPEKEDTCCLNMQKFIKHIANTPGIQKKSKPSVDNILKFNDVNLITLDTLSPDTNDSLNTHILTNSINKNNLPNKDHIKQGSNIIVNNEPNKFESPNLNDNCEDFSAIAQISKQILFEANTANLLPISVVYLEDLFKIIQRNPGYSIQINPPVMPFEIRPTLLKKKRKQAIIQYLLSIGMSNNKIKDNTNMAIGLNNPIELLVNNQRLNCSLNQKNICLDTSTQAQIKLDPTYLAFSNRISLLTSKINYLPDSIAINLASGSAIRGLVNVLNEYPKYQILISAPYGETKGSEAHRKNLSKLRSEVLANFLVKAGIAPKRLHTLGLNVYQIQGSIPLIRVLLPNQDSDNDCIPDNIDECPSLVGTADGNGCPISSDLQDSLNIIMRNVYFDFDKSVAQSSSLPYLDKLASLLNRYPLNLVVVGSTDTIGNYNYNLELSFTRALWIKQYLKDKGISPQRIQALGLGERRNIEGTENERRRNRRVEFWIKN